MGPQKSRSYPKIASHPKIVKSSQNREVISKSRCHLKRTTDQTMEDNRQDNGRTTDKTMGGQRTRQRTRQQEDNGQDNGRTTDKTKGGQQAMVRRTMNNGEEGNRQWRGRQQTI